MLSSFLSMRGAPEYRSIKNATDRVLAAGDPNYVELSIAAKAYFLLKHKEGGVMTARELIAQAGNYNWSISPESVNKAVRFLSAVGLAQEV